MVKVAELFCCIKEQWYISDIVILPWIDSPPPLSFLDNLEQIKSLTFSSALLCCGFPGAGNGFQKVCIPEQEKSFAEVKQTLHGMLMLLTPLFFFCPHRLPPCVHPHSFIWVTPPGPYAGFPELALFFSKLCRSGLLRKGQGDVCQSIWVTVPACAVWWVR